MAFIGMDINEVRNIGNSFTAAADEIESIANRLTSQINNTTWVGSDAHAFSHEWMAEHRSHLQAVASALRDAALRAQRNANEQEQASQ